MTAVTPLAEGFDVPDRAAWVAATEKVLRGRSVADLTVTTLDGVSVPPLYLRDDAPAAPSAGIGRAGRWTILQRHAHPDPGTANAQVLEDLEGGAHGVVLTLALDGGSHGTRVDSVEDLERVLDGVWLDAAPIGLDAGHEWERAARWLLEAWDRAGVTAGRRGGWLGADPVGAVARRGADDPAGAVTDGLARLGTLVAEIDPATTRVRAALADGRPWDDAGATAAQTIGAVLATGHALLGAMVDAGVDVERAARNVTLLLPLGSDQFEAIAALRALRSCWRRVLEVVGVADAADADEVRACSSQRRLTAVDPWVNLLRGTVQAFAAAVGGADGMTVEPFDRALGEPGPLGRRMARNTQVVLAEEAHLAAVADPAGGAWYVEDRTEQLADVAWDELQRILDEGGIAATIAGGGLAGRVADVAARRAARVATRREPITGVTEYPLLGERLPETADGHRVDDDLAAEPAAGGGLPVVRDAGPFERLRAGVEATGSPPVFLANLGSLAEHNARTGFARNAYAVGGFAAVGADSDLSDDEVVAAFRASGARAACICSSDGVYAERAADVARALKGAGAEVVHLAGRFGDHEQAWRAAGIDDVVGLGVDLLSLLRDLARRLAPEVVS